MSWETLLDVTPLWDYLTTALTTPLGIPAMLILVDQWRYPTKRIIRIASLLMLFWAVFFYVVYHTMGVTPFSKTLTGAATPVISFGLFIICTKFRDGRLLFTMITAFLLAGVTEAMACMLAPRECMLWVICKVSLTVVQHLLLIFLVRKPFLRMLKTTGRGWVRMSALPISLILCLSTSYLNPTIMRKMKINPIPTLFLMGTMLLTYAALYYMLSSMRVQYTTNKEHALLSAQMGYLEQQAERLLLAQRESFTFRHDMRHYMELLRGCVAAGDADSLMEVLHGMEESLRKDGEHSLRGYTGNAIIDTVLSLSAERAADAGIGFSVRLELPQIMAVDMVKLAVVISNALENALNACRAIPTGQPRAVEVEGRNGKEQFYLSIRNTYTGEIEYDPETGLPVTRKAGHGYGTQSIAAFAKEYGALLSYSDEDQWVTMGMLI